MGNRGEGHGEIKEMNRLANYRILPKWHQLPSYISVREGLPKINSFDVT